MGALHSRLGYSGCMPARSIIGRAAAFVLAALAILLLNVPTLLDRSGIPGAIGNALYLMEVAREEAAYLAALVAEPPAASLPVPVAGIDASEVADSFGAPRGADRAHEGVDIFAERGTPVVSVTRGIVARVGENRLGGNIVFVLGPGGERYYYAHLDSFAPGLEASQRVEVGAFLGRVGTTGNAAGTPPHLHFGIYGRGGAQDPYPRLQ